MNAFNSLFSKPPTNMSKVAPLLKEAYERREAANREKLLAVAVEVLENVDRRKNDLIMRLRHIRKTEREVREQITQLKRAAQFYEETLNFGPLSSVMTACVTQWAKQLGVMPPTTEDTKIPDGWQPKEDVTVNTE